MPAADPRTVSLGSSSTGADGAPLGRGSVIDGTYVVLDKVGEGAFGRVFRCARKDADLKAPNVAVKILSEVMDEKNASRFARERELLRTINHPNVIRCLDYGLHEGRQYMVMDYAQGGDLSAYLDKRGPLSEALAAWVAYQICAGLRAARTVHRDLKPSNVLLQREGELSMSETGLLVVSDFGLAKGRSGMEGLTGSGEVMGTPSYMSPEQCRSVKHVSESSDVYSLGIMLYEMVVGHVPYGGSTPYDVMRGHCEEEPVYPSTLSVGCRGLLEWMLRKDPGSRPRSYREVQESLRVLMGVGEGWRYRSDVEERVCGGGMVTWLRGKVCGGGMVKWLRGKVGG